MRAALLSPARITFRSLAGIVRVRFVILASARLHREDNSARTAAPFSPVSGVRAQKNRRDFPAGLDASLEDMLLYLNSET
jgi:hypothetical protein